jgi:hypothetical protein
MKPAWLAMYYIVIFQGISPNFPLRSLIYDDIMGLHSYDEPGWQGCNGVEAARVLKIWNDKRAIYHQDNVQTA